jgi:hypothetical protein
MISQVKSYLEKYSGALNLLHTQQLFLKDSSFYNPLKLHDKSGLGASRS